MRRRGAVATLPLVLLVLLLLGLEGLASARLSQGAGTLVLRATQGSEARRIGRSAAFEVWQEVFTRAACPTTSGPAADWYHALRPGGKAGFSDTLHPGDTIAAVKAASDGVVREISDGTVRVVKIVTDPKQASWTSGTLELTLTVKIQTAGVTTVRQRVERRSFRTTLSAGGLPLKVWPGRKLGTWVGGA